MSQNQTLSFFCTRVIRPKKRFGSVRLFRSHLNINELPIQVGTIVELYQTQVFHLVWETNMFVQPKTHLNYYFLWDQPSSHQFLNLFYHRYHISGCIDEDDPLDQSTRPLSLQCNMCEIRKKHFLYSFKIFSNLKWGKGKMYGED